MSTMSRVGSVAFAIVLLSGCAMGYKKDEAALKQPVNCSTAQGDLRTLASEKANLAEEIASGVTMIYPAGLVIGLVTRTEETKYQVATGEYNKMIDARIAEIKTTCKIS
jgi:PBP1b-binding outer membrane lipoprotein LpoB